MRARLGDTSWPSCDPRPPRGRRPSPLATREVVSKVAIHAPLAGGDPERGRDRYGFRVAIHAPLAGGDRRGPGAGAARIPVAIHAPLAGGDSRRARAAARSAGCDPRPPRGRRPSSAVFESPLAKLRSTPPSREATPLGADALDRGPVAIHAPLAGGDLEVSIELLPGPGCDPRPPRGRRRRSGSPRRRCWRCDPRPPRGRRPLVGQVEEMMRALRSTPPSREATPRTA